MKHWIYILLLTIISCNNQQQKVSSSDTLASAKPSFLTDVQNQSNNEICWTGTLNGKTPVFLHYKLDSNLIIGEITYLNTKDKLPIKLLGTIEDDKSYRLLEFEKSGNITGIITGLPTDKIFSGSWFSPKTRKELVLNLVKKDTVINSNTKDTQLQDIFGHYHYQYSEAGYQGDFEITKLPNSKASFGITSVTGEPARNIAQIENDTIALNTTQFIYKMPNTDSCEFSVKFYKGFVYIRYTKGFCDGQFGMNATIDGIFLKTE
ncbi:MAG: hypothetical protein KF862_14640 [Chitinophagaceae bacterium]|nr:hypothetical protein [Chitinophagaceae bacterium]